MKFDPSGLQRSFDALSKRASDRGTTLAKQKGNFFVRMARKISWDSAPSVEELQAVRARVGWKMIMHGKAKTPDEELARRIKMRGKYAKSWRLLKMETSMVGYRIRIWIRNRMGYSKLIDDRDHSADKAANFVKGTFSRDLQRLAKSLTGDFGK
jgi:hypothetical protein